MRQSPAGKGTAVKGSGDIKAATAVKCCCEEPSGEEAEPRQEHGAEKGRSDSSSQGQREIITGV